MAGEDHQPLEYDHFKWLNFLCCSFRLLTNLFRIPFNLYETFVIEERYGFNVMSL